MHLIGLEKELIKYYKPQDPPLKRTKQPIILLDLLRYCLLTNSINTATQIKDKIIQPNFLRNYERTVTLTLRP